MKSTQRAFRVFLDTSVLLSGLNSPQGASGFIISLFKLNKVKIVISPEVIAEAEEAIKSKFSLLKTQYLDFFTHKPKVTENLKNSELKDCYKIISTDDAPILAGAIKANADYLITLDKKFQKLAKDKTKINIVSSGEFLKIYRDG